MKEPEAEVLETTDKAGSVIYYERHENILPRTEIDHDENLKLGCEACRKFGKNLACPPYSPTLSEYIGGAARARIICMRIPLSQFSHIVMTEEKYRTGYRKARGLLEDGLRKYRGEGRIVAGSGACLACGQCAIERGEENCEYPSKRVYSLESLGVNIISLSEKAFKFSLQWSGNEYAADYVSAIGAVFHEQEVA